jgi:hypothetical protein
MNKEVACLIFTIGCNPPAVLTLLESLGKKGSLCGKEDILKSDRTLKNPFHDKYGPIHLNQHINILVFNYILNIIHIYILPCNKKVPTGKT